MKKIAYSAFASVAALALAACGSSDSASEEAAADNVEMPAEESMSSAGASASPVADASAAPSADASTAPAAEAATTEAEKKM